MKKTPPPSTSIITFSNFLDANDLLQKLAPETELYVVLIGDTYSAAQDAIAELRREGVNVAVDTSGRKLDKQIRTAEKKGITNVLFIGDAELKSGQFKLKNIKTGEEQTLSLARLVAKVKDVRN